ncbi:MAG: DUF4292 domain-containing protein [Phaeodactylibacter sp.]|nr:DUF4292 domain-containing protein [Phaeodactylibacter sp.]
MKITVQILISCAFLLGLSSLNSCSATRKGGKVAKKEVNADFLLKQMARQKLRPEWFSARTSIDYDDGSQSFSASATIRMRRDSLLWISIKKLGFELARVQVTRDSVYVLDRINNEYAIEGLGYLSQSYGLPADLTHLQDVILGNPVFFESKGLQVEPLGPSYHLMGRGLAIESDYWIDPNGFVLRKMAFNDKKNSQQVNMLFEEYGETPDNQKFSYLRKLEMNSQNSGKAAVSMKFSKLDTEIPKSIRFEIPDRYTRTK